MAIFKRTSASTSTSPLKSSVAGIAASAASAPESLYDVVGDAYGTYGG